MKSFFAADTADVGNQVIDLLRDFPLVAFTFLWVIDKIGNNSERNYLRNENQALRSALEEANKALKEANAAQAAALQIIAKQ